MVRNSTISWYRSSHRVERSMCSEIRLRIGRNEAYSEDAESGLDAVNGVILRRACWNSFGKTRSRNFLHTREMDFRVLSSESVSSKVGMLRSLWRDGAGSFENEKI